MDSSHSIRQLLHRRLVLLTGAFLGALIVLAAFLAATPWLNQVSSDRLLPGLFRVLLLWGLIAFMLATGAALLDRLRQHRNLRGLDLSQTKADLLAQAESVGLNGTLVLSGHHLLNLTDLSGMDLRQATALTLWFLPGDRDAWLFARKDRAPLVPLPFTGASLREDGSRGSLEQFMETVRRRYPQLQSESDRAALGPDSVRALKFLSGKGSLFALYLSSSLLMKSGIAAPWLFGVLAAFPVYYWVRRIRLYDQLSRRTAGLAELILYLALLGLLAWIRPFLNDGELSLMMLPYLVFLIVRNLWLYNQRPRPVVIVPDIATRQDR